MKKINLLFLFTVFSSLSFTKSNESFFTLTSFELAFNEDRSKLIVTNKYSSSIEDPYKYCDVSWVICRDGVDEYIYHVRLSNFKVASNVEVPQHPEIDIASLGYENYIVLYIYPSDTKVYQVEKLRINVKGQSQVTFSEKDNNVGVSSGYYIESRSTYEESKNFVLEDRVIFTNYEDLIVEVYYLNFDIRRFNFIYKGNKQLLEGDFYFLIYDKYNLFNELPIYKDSQYRYIRLESNITNSNSSFSFKDKVYYDPLTHNTSITYKEGYKETDKLYFPMGKLNQLKSIHCMLSLDINGYTNFNMSSEFDIYFLKNYFGDCSDSEYCVTMNEDDGNNIREKVVDINL